ncbi:MAG: choice-of-anchor D domain-containing protein [Calditrichaeota bacterium]|nr:choice-of-anchor D domain-containing protein [Calditrichota bacterium]
MLKSNLVFFITAVLICGSLNAEILEIGSFNTPGDANDIVVVGEFAYVADNQAGLRIIDISNPEDPAEIGFVDTPGSALSVVVSGDIALIGDGPRGLIIVDISNPEEPEVIGSFADECIINGVAIDGESAYLSDVIGGFRVLDISDPENPRQLAEIETPDVAQDVFVSGNFAYVADRLSGMIVFDISDPSNPEEVGVYNSPGEAMSIAVENNIAYIADEIDGLQIVSVRRPEGPSRYGRLDTEGFAYGVAVSGNYAFIADGSEGLKIVNISDPREPELIGGFDTPETSYKVAVSDGLIYLADGESGIRVISAIPSIDISHEDLEFEPTNLNSSLSRTLTISNEGHSDLIILDAVLDGDDFSTNFEAEVVISANETHGIRVTFTPEVINRHEGTLTILSNDPELGEITIDLSGFGMGAIRQLSYLPSRDVTRDVKVRGNLAYVADGNILKILDIVNPQRPRELGIINLPDVIYRICLDEDDETLVYVATLNVGLRIIDVSDLDRPVEIGHLDTPGRMYDLVNSGDLIYIGEASRDDHFRIVDVSDPENPNEIGSLDVPAYGIAIQDNFAYLGFNQLIIADINDPEEPRRVSVANFNGYARKIEVHGDFAYLATDQIPNLTILGIADPEQPFQIDTHGYDIPGTGYDLDFRQNKIFLANRDAGLYVIDVTDPEYPVDVGIHDTPGTAWAISISGDLAFVADIQGLAILDVSAFLDPLPIIELDQNEIDFGRIPVDEIEERTLTIGNLGRAALNILNIQVEEAGFSTDFEDEIEIAPGESVDIQVFFAPEEARDYAGILTIMANDPENEEITIELTGASIDELRLLFEAGWNLVSLNIIPPEEYYRRGENRGPDVVLMLDQLRIDDDQHRVLLMKNEGGRFYAPGWDFNNIPYWNLTQGYQVKMEEGAEAIYSGIRIPADADIPLEEGWNIIAYYPPFELEAGSPDFYVLSPIIDNLIIAKDNYGRFISPEWEFSNMPPWCETQGYQVSVNADVILSYPVEQEDVRGVECPNLTDNTLPLLCRGGRSVATGQNMSVLITRIKSDVGNLIGAFSAEGNLVGAGIIDSDGRCGIAVWGDDKSTDVKDGLAEGESFELRYWDTASVKEIEFEVKAIQAGNGLVYRTNSFTVIDIIQTPKIPTDYYLSQNYPNPFNSTTQIRFGLPEAGHVSIRVFDLSGRIVATIINKQAEAGHHAVEWNAGHVSSGLYLLQLETADFKAKSKAVLVK